MPATVTSSDRWDRLLTASVDGGTHNAVTTAAPGGERGAVARMHEAATLPTPVNDRRMAGAQGHQANIVTYRHSQRKLPTVPVGLRMAVIKGTPPVAHAPANRGPAIQAGSRRAFPVASTAP